MVDPEKDIASFTLRFVQQRWRDTDGEPKIQWRGIIRHVQSDDETTFVEFTDVLTFIQEHLTQLTLEATSRDSKSEQDKYLRESFRIWEQFADRYGDIILSAMERSIEQSEAFRVQMAQAAEQAMQAIRSPAAYDLAEALSLLETVRGELARLSDKIDQLTASRG